MPGIELIGGPEERPVTIVEYDPTWADVFATERRRIAEVLDELPHRLEHVGSTAVPRLAAKPIVDLQLSVADVEEEHAYLPHLQGSATASASGKPGTGCSGRSPAQSTCTCATPGGEWERRHLLFRDWLRTSPDDRRRYEAAKRRLAERDWPTMNHYAAAKDDVIGEVTARAEAWAAAVGWSPRAFPTGARG